jgi:hypothetical protein
VIYYRQLVKDTGRKKGGRKMQLINLTPHAINLIVNGGTITIPPSGQVLRAEETATVQFHLTLPEGEVPVKKMEFGAPNFIPEQMPDTYYIVSALAAQALRRHQPDRNDFLIVADSVRDDQGRIVGARALARYE